MEKLWYTYSKLEVPNRVRRDQPGSRSQKIILQSSRSRLGLGKSFYRVLGIISSLEILTKPSLGLVSVSKKVVSSNPEKWLR